MPNRDELARDTLALILAGGNGTRLGELTRWQCKPAVPFAGHFRNIDFTLSNCVNSHVRRIGVLTQYKSQTLLDHLARGWSFLPRHLGEFVDAWPAQQRQQPSWYAGTADAVYQNIDLIRAQRAKYTLILAGDHVYRMDYRTLLARHVGTGADVTIACLPVPREQSGSFGIMGVDEYGRVHSFVEKPPPDSLTGAGPIVLASMGIYVFDTDYLIDRLERDARDASSSHDFGHDVIPAAVRSDHVEAFAFTEPSGRPGYWRDVGTLDAYWQAHMELLGSEPPLDLHDPRWPIWTSPAQAAPARLIYDRPHRGFVANSLLSGGVVVRAATVTNSVLSTNVQVDRDTIIDQAVVLPGARIGASCTLRRVIVDCDTEVPDGMEIDGAEIGDSPGSRVALLTRTTRPTTGMRCVA